MPDPFVGLPPITSPELPGQAPISGPLTLPAFQVSPGLARPSEAVLQRIRALTPAAPALQAATVGNSGFWTGRSLFGLPRWAVAAGALASGYLVSRWR